MQTPRRHRKRRSPILTTDQVMGFLFELLFVAAVALAGVPFLVER